MQANTLYTTDIRDFLWSQPWPKGLIWEVEEKESFLRIRFFRGNLNTLDNDSKLKLVTILNEVLWGIRNRGIPIYTEVAEGNGKRV